MAELEQRVQQLESELRELRAILETEREAIDHLTYRMDRVHPEINGPLAKDVQRAFGGRVFGVVGHRGEFGGFGGGPEDLRTLSLRFTVQGEDVEVETARDDPHEESALVRVALRALTPVGPDGQITRPPLPLTLTLEERAARLRVCGRAHDFKGYVYADHASAFAPVDDLWVRVDLPTALLDSQAIELHDEAKFRTRDEPVDAQ